MSISAVEEVPPWPVCAATSPSECSAAGGEADEAAEADEETLCRVIERWADQSTPEALASLEWFDGCVQREVVSSTLRASSRLTAKALLELQRQHTEVVGKLTTENRALQQQVVEAANVVQLLSSLVPPDVIASRRPTTVESDELSLLGSESSHLSHALFSGEDHRANEAAGAKQRPALDEPGLVGLVSTPPGSDAGRGRASMESVTYPAEGRSVERRADPSKRVGNLSTIDQEVVSQLARTIHQLVEDNASLRSENGMLRVSRVPAEELLEVMEGKLEAELQLTALQGVCSALTVKVEDMALAHAAALQQLESLQQVTPYSEVPQSEAVSAPDPEDTVDFGRGSTGGPAQEEVHRRFYAAREGSDVGPALPDPKELLGCDALRIRNENLWRQAIRELEDRAAIAVNQNSIAEQVKALEAQNRALVEEKATVASTLDELRAVHANVCADCEALTFQNSVLTTQLASVLVRLERQLGAGEPAAVERGSGGWSQPWEESGRHSSSPPSATHEHPWPIRRAGRVSRTSDSLDVSFRPPPLQAESPTLVEKLGVYARAARVSATGRMVEQPVAQLVHMRQLGRRSLATTGVGLPATGELSGAPLGLPFQCRVGFPSALRQAADEMAVASSATEDQMRQVLDGFENGSVADQERLGVFAANSVLELVRRNNELVRQLYLSSRSAGEQLDTAAAGAGVDSRSVLADKDADAACPRGSTLARPATPVKRPRSEAASAPALPAEPTFPLQCIGVQTDSPLSFNRRSAGDNTINEAIRVSLQNLTEVLKTHHEVESVARSESDAQRIWQTLATLVTVSDGNAAETHNTETEAGATVGGSAPSPPPTLSWLTGSEAQDQVRQDVVTALIELCTTQAVQLTENATIIADFHRDLEAARRREAEETKSIITNSLRDLRNTIAAVIETQLLDKQSPHHTAPTEEHAPVDGTAPGLEETDAAAATESQVASLWSTIMSLLQTATQKEHTLRRVIQAARERQRHVQRECESQGQGDPLDSGTASSSRGTSKRQRCERCDAPTQGTSCGVPIDVSITGALAADAADDLSAEKLREILAVERDKFRGQMDDLHREKSEHAVLLERMWMLEEELAEAVNAKDVALADMACMMHRTEYESLTKEHDRVIARADDLERQLADASNELTGLRLRTEELLAERSATSEAVEQTEMNFTRQMQEKDRYIATQVERTHLLEKRCTQFITENQKVEREVEARDALLAEQQRQYAALEAQLNEARVAVLELECTQDLLRALYPGDAVLDANAQLVATLTKERAAAYEKVAELGLELSTTQEELERERKKWRDERSQRQEAQTGLWHEVGSQRPAPPGLSGAAQPELGGDISALPPLLRVEVEALRSESFAWRREREQLLQRETTLRQQVAALSRDPISECARKYGLAASKRLEDLIHELQARNTRVAEECEAAHEHRKELDSAVEALRGEVEAERAKVQEVESRLHAERQERQAAEEKARALSAEVAQQAQHHQKVSMTLAEKDELITHINSVIANLEHSIENLELRTKEQEAELINFREDNITLIETVKALSEDLRKKEEERSAAVSVAIGAGLHVGGATAHVSGGGSPRQTDAAAVPGAAGSTSVFSFSSTSSTSFSPFPRQAGETGGRSGSAVFATSFATPLQQRP